MLAFVLGALLAAAFFRPGVLAWLSPALTVVVLLLGGMFLLGVLLEGLDRISRWFWSLTRWPRTD